MPFRSRKQNCSANRDVNHNDDNENDEDDESSDDDDDNNDIGDDLYDYDDGENICEISYFSYCFFNKIFSNLHRVAEHDRARFIPNELYIAQGKLTNFPISRHEADLYMALPLNFRPIHTSWVMWSVSSHPHFFKKISQDPF